MNRSIDDKSRTPSPSAFNNEFSSIYDEYAPALFGIIVRLIPKAEEHERLFTKSFDLIRSQYASFDPSKQRLFSWMSAIVLKVVVDWHEREGGMIF